MKNPCGKMVKEPYRENAYEVWRTIDGQWTWYVLKKWNLDDNHPNSRWFCLVESPFVPNGELGDCYSLDVISSAERIR